VSPAAILALWCSWVTLLAVRVDPLTPPPSSSVKPYELTFGTVCGICAGVFIKKGAKALAFMLGGVFVLLQVRSSCVGVDPAVC
jgi:hypothetical protein